MNKIFTKEDISKSDEYKKTKTDIKRAVKTNGQYSFQVISYGLKSLKDQFGDLAVEMIVEEIPDVNLHVIIPK